MTGVLSIGAYAPRGRITAEAIADAWGRFQGSGIDEKAVPAADEDALTMAYEAGARALDAGEIERREVDWLGFASTTPPLAEEDLSVRLGAMLGLEEKVSANVFTGSTRAGTRALFAAMDATEAGSERALVVAADAPRGDPDTSIDHAAGAGAAAFVIAPTGPARIVDRTEFSRPYPGTRFRETGSETTEGLGVTSYDRRAFSETVGGAVDGLEGDSGPVAVAIQAPDGTLPYRVTDRIDVEAEAIQRCATVHDLGDTGAASVPLSVARALAAGEESTLAVSYGSGAGADAFDVECDGTVPTSLDLDGERTMSYAEYLRARGAVTSGPPDGGGAYVSVPTWQRSIPQRYRLEAGRCLDCSDLAFPPEGACPSCGSLADYERVELDSRGTIEAVTTISAGGAPPEFAEQQARSGDYAAAIVALESGGETVSAPMMGCAECEGFAVDDRVETTIRRLYTQEGVTRYARKIRPAE
ncbi:zinc ribbon domain-containing protein [Natronorarus salvus]|uniref:zinc ribbon domain-containing protein n=1 Tax=Natronorarus salvus TaxID=3117733 RepID=UPI002F25EB4F